MTDLFYSLKSGVLISHEHDIRNMAKFETPVQAWDRRERLRSIIRDIPEATLHNCRLPKAPCNSAACPRCMREFRIWFGAAGMRAMEYNGPMTALSVVHCDWQRAPGALHTLDLEKLKRQARRHIERAGLSDVVGIGGIDFSFNEHSDKRWEPHWQAHLYLILQGAPAAQIKKALAAFYPVTVSVPRPLKARRVDTPAGAFSYAMKAIFDRRVSYVDGNRNGNDNTKDYPLRPAQLRELVVFLDRHQPTDRLFLRNVRRRGAELVITTKQDSKKLSPTK